MVPVRLSYCKTCTAKQLRSPYRTPQHRRNVLITSFRTIKRRIQASVYENTNPSLDVHLLKDKFAVTNVCVKHFVWQC